jgi:hypothetical protein
MTSTAKILKVEVLLGSSTCDLRVSFFKKLKETVVQMSTPVNVKVAT